MRLTHLFIYYYYYEHLAAGSKSISNRVLLMAAMGKGSCAITGLLQSDDTQARADERLITC